jgi:diguanylate cyclase (GGDEF)-like protein
MQPREEFLKLIDEAITLSANERGVVALLIVKIKQFKDINTTYGLETGDELLRRSEQRLNHVLRPVDQLARIGDSEYCIVLPALKNSSHAILAANKIIDEFQQPFAFDAHFIQPRLVIGIAAYDRDGMTYNELIQNATKALMEAERGNEDYRLFVTQSGGLPPSMILENEMHLAYEREEYSLHYQPKIDLLNKKLDGFEALIRWFSPKYGTVNTQHFVDVLEGSNLLMPVTKWVLNTALRQCVEWQKFGDKFSISINLSPALLNNYEIVDVAVGAVKIWGVDPSCLILEVTEGAMMQNPDLCLDILKKIHDAGIGISIDDFGTGYSSLAYLKYLPARELKIDKSFVINMLEDPRDKSIVKAAIDMAHNLGLEIVAEGIESQAMLDSLMEIGCDHGQGYYMARPMPDTEIKQWLSDSPWASNVDIVPETEDSETNEKAG